ncbi:MULTISPECIES: cytochrome C oxidase subunit IV family protein [Aequorivita]|uniref:Cytochrome C oxidase subunit IV family protein n=1 Tax=Aequorivita iocasae TaxID=2803865 RepID=A0ABX7DVB2_9FLAO|nr:MULTISPECIES: cytochrome C oxidase subunit IV family protein [Aequorivita]QQX77913.1 cytochrome C oxidase subunit IV family protein [Aequorivita iocasae]UCA57413.1 cytochrome C oxidase subunit IV family protein [Aequorivita sp. F7]
MAHEHKLAIFRGAVKFKSNVSKIWGVFAFLSIVTIVEVALGIIRPEFLIDTRFLALKLLNWIFIILTIVKAYYITWDFMHMRDETSGLRRAIIWTSIFLIAYLVVLVLIEGDYIFEVYKSGFIKFDF